MTHRTVYNLLIEGHCPCKKNGKRARGKRVVIDTDVKAQIAGLRWLVKEAWVKANGTVQCRPVDRARLHMTFYVRDQRPDLDGKYTTMQDILVAEHILVNDSIAHVPAYGTMAIIDPQERCEIRIEVLA